MCWLDGRGGGGGGGAWPGTGVKPAGDLGLLYLVRHLGGPEPLHDEVGGNDATESVHTYRGMVKIIVSRMSAAWGGGGGGGWQTSPHTVLGGVQTGMGLPR